MFKTPSEPFSAQRPPIGRWLVLGGAGLVGAEGFDIG